MTTLFLASKQSRAFSLIEIVLALGIISFALVGILGLFPAAMDAATNSQRETQAALIAQALYSEINSMPGTNTFVSYGTNFYKEPTSSNDKITINLTQQTNFFLAYDQGGNPLKSIGSGAFDGGDSSAAYLAEISVSTNNVPVGLSRVDIRIDAPGGAPEKARRSYYFATLLNQKNTP